MTSEQITHTATILVAALQHATDCGHTPQNIHSILVGMCLAINAVHGHKTELLVVKEIERITRSNKHITTHAEKHTIADSIIDGMNKDNAK